MGGGCQGSSQARLVLRVSGDLWVGPPVEFSWGDSSLAGMCRVAYCLVALTGDCSLVLTRNYSIIVVAVNSVVVVGEGLVFPSGGVQASLCLWYEVCLYYQKGILSACDVQWAPLKLWRAPLEGETVSSLIGGVCVSLWRSSRLLALWVPHSLFMGLLLSCCEGFHKPSHADFLKCVSIGDRKSSV